MKKDNNTDDSLEFQRDVSQRTLLGIYDNNDFSSVVEDYHSSNFVFDDSNSTSEVIEYNSSTNNITASSEVDESDEDNSSEVWLSTEDYDTFREN